MVDFPRFSTFFVGSSVRIEVAPGPRSPSRNGGCSTGPGGRLLGLEMLGHLGTERLLRRETGLLGLWTTWSMDDVYIYMYIMYYYVMNHFRCLFLGFAFLDFFGHPPLKTASCLVDQFPGWLIRIEGFCIICQASRDSAAGTCCIFWCFFWHKIDGCWR